MVLNMDSAASTLNYKFVVDAMLGNLARWLRILGYDTLYDKNYQYWKILEISKREGRTIITRNSHLAKKAYKMGLSYVLIPKGINVIETLIYLKQNGVINVEYPISPIRCTVCNGPLEKFDIGKWKCSKCGKIYWKGSHWNTIQKTVIKVANSKLYDDGEPIKSK
ncbi:hypothetical protein HS7_18160 [Sulfolobales archaeon HS-7]|nr:hypothetical protein HS7_18160 [Sulfolobales archaeon HS-7]